MPNLTTECFWGPADKKNFRDELLDLILKHFKSTEDVFAGDNLIVIGRNLTFLSDEKFMRSFYCIFSPDNYVAAGIIWRLYVFCSSAHSCLPLEGDFVECGVSTGASSRLMCDYLGFESTGKRLWLYDLFGPDPRLDTMKYPWQNNNILDQIKTAFATYPNVEVKPGFIPESFGTGRPDKISFLHIDLNNVEAEISVLEHLYDSVVPGGIILFDDYGFNGYRAQQMAEDRWMAERGQKILELPTGQGLLVKR